MVEGLVARLLDHQRRRLTGPRAALRTVAQHRILDVFDDVRPRLRLVVVRIGVDNEQVLIVALLRLARGVRQVVGRVVAGALARDNRARKVGEIRHSIDRRCHVCSPPTVDRTCATSPARTAPGELRAAARWPFLRHLSR